MHLFELICGLIWLLGVGGLVFCCRAPKAKPEEVADFEWETFGADDCFELDRLLNGTEPGWIFDDVMPNGEGALVLLKRPKGGAK